MICARKEEFTSRRPLALASSRVWNTPDLPVIGIKRWSQLEMKDRNKSKLTKGIEMEVKSIRQANDWVRKRVIDRVHVRVCKEEGKWWYPWNYSCINIRNMNNEFDLLRIWLTHSPFGLPSTRSTHCWLSTLQKREILKFNWVGDKGIKFQNYYNKS